MAKLPKMSFKTPLCELMWIVISGQGKLKYEKPDDGNFENYQYQATARLTKAQADKLTKEFQKFWRENKPAGATKQSYDLIKPEMEPDLDADGNEQFDEDDALIVKPTGFYTLQAKTVTHWGENKPNRVKVLRANGDPLQLGDTQIGNGSLGVIHGEIGINAFKGNEGLAFYLKAIQLKKLVPYSESEVEADDLGEDEGMDELDLINASDLNTEDGPKI